MEKFHIDLMLFLIDSAANHIEELDLKPLRNVFEIEDYLAFAQENLNAKITEETLSGSDTIVPRNRIPLDRMRGKTGKRF